VISAILSGCLPGSNIGGSSDVNNNVTPYSSPEHLIDKDPNKKLSKEELYKRVVRDYENRPAKVEQKKVIDNTLVKLPWQLLDKHDDTNSSIERVASDWEGTLTRHSIDPNQRTKDMNGEDVAAKDLPAHLYRDNGKLKILVRADDGINYESNGENRKQLLYATIKAMLSGHEVELDGNFIQALRVEKNNRYLEGNNVKELLAISDLTAEIINDDKYREIAENALAYLLVNYHEEPEGMTYFYPEMASYLDKFEHGRLELVDDVNSDNNNIQEYDISTGHGSRDLNWGNDKNDCLAKVKCSIIQKFRNPVSSNVVGYEWELRNGVTKLDPKEVSMDQVLATSKINVNQSGSPMPYIKLVVEENKDNAFIEVVTAPLTKDVMNNKDFKSALDCIYRVLSGGGTKTLTDFTSMYNQLIKKYSVSADYILQANQELKDIKIEMKKPERAFFQQTNLLLDISKIFSNTPGNLRFFEEQVFNSSSKSIQSDYNLFKKAITSEMISSPLVGLNNENRIILANGVAATLHKQMLFNFLVMLRSSIKNEQQSDVNSNLNEEVSFFIRSAPEDLIYSVLSKEDITALQVFYEKITFPKNAVGTDSDGEQLYVKLFTKLAKDAGIKLPSYTFKPGEITTQEIAGLAKNTIYKDKDGKYWQSNKNSQVELRLKKSLSNIQSNNPHQLTEEEVNGYFIGVQSSFNDTFNNYYSKLFKGPIRYRVGRSPVKIYNYTKIEKDGNTKGYLFNKISDDEISSTKLNYYIMPRKWGHEPLLLTGENSSRQINTVVEFRIGRVGTPNKNVWGGPNVNSDFSHVENFYRKYSDLWSNFGVDNLAIKDDLL
jgi:hypothetical protein